MRVVDPWRAPRPTPGPPRARRPSTPRPRDSTPRSVRATPPATVVEANDLRPVGRCRTIGAFACTSAIAAWRMYRPGLRRAQALVDQVLACAMAATSHCDRSCSSRRSSAPSAPTRVARRASVTNIRARQTANLAFVRHQLSKDAGQVHRLVDELGAHQRRAGRRGVPHREEQVDHAQHRARGARASPPRPASASGMRAVAIFCFALVRRAPIVVSDTKNSRAMSSVDMPQTRRSVSAICASGANAG